MAKGDFVNRTYQQAMAAPSASVWKNAVLPVAAAFGGPALAGLFTGGAGAAAGAGAGASMSAPAAAGAATSAGRLATLGKLFSSSGFDTAVNAGTTLYGMKKGHQAADTARADQIEYQKKALALEIARLEAETRNADLDRADAKALNDAINALKQQELDLQIEQRDYTRSQDAFERGEYTARQTRLAPYRQASETALNKLMGMWGGQ